MSFLVTACGHSGTRLFSLQLGSAPGWTVLHEPDGYISARVASLRFEGRPLYGEVNSFLLTSARYIAADRKAILLRNPYDIVASILRGGGHESQTIGYVREGISILDNLARDGLKVIKFRGITRNRAYVVECARHLGIETLTKEMVRVRTRINPNPGPTPNISYDRVSRDEFDRFIYTYEL